MPFLSVILVAEIIFASIALNINPGNTNRRPLLKQKQSNILGVQLAQTDSADNTQSTPPSDSSVNTNDSQPPTEQTSQNSQTAADNSSSNNPAAPTQSSSNPAYFNDIVNTANQPEDTSTPQPQISESQQNPSETPREVTIVPSVSEGVSPEAEPSPTIPVSFPNQTAAVLDQNDLLNTPENINTQSIDEAEKEEDTISQTTDPEDQTKLLINFAVDKVKDINNFIETDDFASTNFASQRLNAQIDKAMENLANLTPAKAKQLQKQLANFCSQADYILKTVELSVPEDAEQDIEINRAKCMDITQ